MTYYALLTGWTVFCFMLGWHMHSVTRKTWADRVREAEEEIDRWAKEIEEEKQ